MRAAAMVRTNSKNIHRLAVRQRRAGDRDQIVDRHRLRRRVEIGQLRNQAGAMPARFAHADDAAAAHLEAGVAHAAQGIEPILIGVGGDDLAVKLRARCRDCGCSNPARLACNCRPAPSLSIPSVTQVSRPSALTARTMSRQRSISFSFGPRQAAPMQNRAAPLSLAAWAAATTSSSANSGSGLPAGLVALGLGTVAAILGTVAGLDRQQGGALHRVGIEMGAQGFLCLEHQIGEGQLKQRQHGIQGPGRRGMSRWPRRSRAGNNRWSIHG